MSAALQQIREKYGSDAASDMERIMQKAINDEVLPNLARLQQIISKALSSFTAAEMVPATDLQKKSFRTLRDRLKKHAKLLLLYKSTPSAILFDVTALAEIEEQLAATIAAFHWEAHEGRDVSPEEFWQAIDTAKPGP